MIKGLPSLSYGNSLRHLDLSSKSYRRLQDYLTLAYHILKDDLRINMLYFSFHIGLTIRRHSKRVLKLILNC